MKIIYNKKTREVVSITDGEITVDDNFTIKEITLTEQQQDFVDKNYKIKVSKNGSLHFVEPPWVVKQKKEEEIETLKDDILKAKTVDDMKEKIITILDIIKK